MKKILIIALLTNSFAASAKEPIDFCDNSMGYEEAAYSVMSSYKLTLRPGKSILENINEITPDASIDKYIGRLDSYLDQPPHEYKLRVNTGSFGNKEPKLEMYSESGKKWKSTGGSLNNICNSLTYYRIYPLINSNYSEIINSLYSKRDGRANQYSDKVLSRTSAKEAALATSLAAQKSKIEAERLEAKRKAEAKARANERKAEERRKAEVIAAEEEAKRLAAIRKEEARIEKVKAPIRAELAKLEDEMKDSKDEYRQLSKSYNSLLANVVQVVAAKRKDNIVLGTAYGYGGGGILRIVDRGRLIKSGLNDVCLYDSGDVFEYVDANGFDAQLPEIIAIKDCAEWNKMIDNGSKGGPLLDKMKTLKAEYASMKVRKVDLEKSLLEAQ